jgi:broad specificity phosphatase PhoE
MRAKEALTWLDEHVKESAVVIAHSGINRLLLSSMMGIELANKKTIHQEYGCVNLFVKNDQGWTVEAVALTAEEFENRYVKTESERDRIK